MPQQVSGGRWVNKIGGDKVLPLIELLREGIFVADELREVHIKTDCTGLRVLPARGGNPTWLTDRVASVLTE